MKKFYMNIQCKGDDDRIGSFLTDEKGYQVTITFVDLVNLFNSSTYQELRENHTIIGI